MFLLTESKFPPNKSLKSTYVISETVADLIAVFFSKTETLKQSSVTYVHFWAVSQCMGNHSCCSWRCLSSQIPVKMCMQRVQES